MKKMKLLIVGSNKVYAIENYYAKYIEEFGWDVYHYPASSIFFDYYNQGNLLVKITHKLGLSNIIKTINNELIGIANKFCPDVIWIFKGMQIMPETLRALHDTGIFLVNYNPDNPFIFTGKGSGNEFISGSLKYYDLHFTYNMEIKQMLEENLKAPVCYLPFGFDIPESLYERANILDEKVKVCFLGNPDKVRADFLLGIAKNGIELDVYGNNWSAFLSHPRVTVYPPVYNDELWLTLRRYRVQLNLMRVHNLDSHNMRTFEVPAIGGIELAPRTKEHEQFFTDGANIFFFDDIADCALKAKKILSMSLDEANQIRRSARETSIIQGYSYRDRSKTVVSEIQKMVVAKG